MRRKSVRLSWAIAALVIAGCGDAAEGLPEWTGSVDTTASGIVVVRNPSTPSWDSANAWRLADTVLLGTIEGGGPEQFGDVRAVELDPRGHLWVLDNQAKEIRVFDAEGEHVRTIGGDGEGPGEFRNPTGLTWDPTGRLWVMDPRLDRYSVFDTSGALVATYRRPIGSWGYVWDGRFGTDGRLYERTSRITGVDANGRTQREGVFVALTFDSAGLAAADTFAFSGPSEDRPPSYFRVEYPAGSPIVNSIRRIPYAATGAMTFDPAGYLWGGRGDDYLVGKATLTGDTVIILEREFTPEAVSDAEQERALEELLGDLRPGAIYEDPVIPDVKPAFDELIIDDAGYLWVRVGSSIDAAEGSATRSTFDVFHPTGRYLGRLETPYSPGKPPVIRGDRIAGVTVDELGINYVAAYRIAGRDVPRPDLASRR